MVKSRITLSQLELLVGKDMEPTCDPRGICFVRSNDHNIAVCVDEQVCVDGKPTGVYIEEAQRSWGQGGDFSG